MSACLTDGVPHTFINGYCALCNQPERDEEEES